jgi:hypothetical protein
MAVASAVEGNGPGKSQETRGNAPARALVSRGNARKQTAARHGGGPEPTAVMIGSRSMIRFVLNAYLVGIVLFFMLFALQTPNLPVRDAAVSALVWPYGIYKHFVV